MKLDAFLRAEQSLILANPTSRDSVLRALAGCAHGRFPSLSAEVLYQGLKEREEKYPTCTPEGVAFPHVLLPQIDSSLLVPCVLRPGVAWGRPQPVKQDIVFAMFGSADRPWEHVRMLARLARISRGPGALDRIRAAADPSQLHAQLLVEDRAYA